MTASRSTADFLIKTLPLFLLLIFVAPVFAQNPADELTLDKPLTRQIKGGETHSFQFKLKAGEYARVEVEQKDIDVVVSLFDSNEKLVVEMDGKDGKLWYEAISVISKKNDACRVEIKAYGITEMTGNYTVKLAERRKAAAKDNQRLEAEQHLSAGRRLYEQGEKKFQEAVKEYETAIALWRELGETEWEAATFLNLGWTYNSLSKNEQAIEAQTRATKLFQKTKDRMGEGKAVNGIGNALNSLKQYDKALEIYEKALVIRKEIGDRQGEGNTLNNLGYVYNSLERLEKARDYYERALSVKRELKDVWGQIDLLFALTVTYDWKSQIARTKRLEYLEQTLVLVRNLENYQEKLQQFNIICQYISLVYQNEKNSQCFEEALSISRKARDRRTEMQFLTALSISYQGIDVEKAISYQEQSLSVAREMKDKGWEMAQLGELAGIYERGGRYEKALKCYEKLALLSRETKNRRREMTALENIGNLYFDLKNYEKARIYYEQAIAIHQEFKLDDPERYSNELRDLGVIYSRLKQYEKALELYNLRLVQLRDRFMGYLEEAATITELANLFKEQKQYGKAQEYLEQKLALGRKKKAEWIESSAFIELGELFQETEQYEKARDCYEQSLNIELEKLKRPDAEGQPLFLLGKLYLEQKQFEKARGYLERALTSFRKKQPLGDTRSIAFDGDTLFVMAELYKGLRQPQLSIFYAKRAVNAYQLARAEIKNFDKETQRSFVKDKEPAYRKLADLLIAEGRLTEAQTVLDLLKEEEYKTLVPNRSGEMPATVPYSRAESEVAATVENLAKLERERADLLKQKEAGALSAEQQIRLDAIPNDIEAANRAFRLALDALGKTEASSAARVAEIQSEKSLQRALQTLDAETASQAVALYTVLGTEEDNDNKTKTKFGWVILVTPTARKAYPIDVADLEQTVFQFRDALSNDRYDPRPVAGKLYDKIFRQTSEKQKTTLEADLQTLFGGDNSKNKTLMWSLDGILRYVPMAALYDGKNYLVERYANVVFTKESFLTLTESNAAKWNALGLGVSEKRENFNALPGAEKELKDIVRVPQTKTGILDGEIKLNKDFAEEATLKLFREGKFPVIHIASHYSFNPTDPTSSYLLVGDGQLSFSEMQDKDNLFGAIDLLTLSACDTATSGNGKEAEGFAYLAQSLGAKSVIASLWKVSDAGTPELMIRFYKLRNENPQMSKGEAFRQAQLSLLGAEGNSGDKSSAANRSEIVGLSGKKIELPLFEKDEKKPFAHPHYWSSFVLIGNWK